MEFREYSDVVNAWIKETLDSRGVDAERTLKCCIDIAQYAQKTNDAKLMGFAFYYSGETYYLLNDGDRLFENITKAISYLDQSEQWELVARSYNIMAITSANRGNAPIAMDYYLTGLNYCRKYKLYQVESIINLNLGTLYMNSGQYTEAQHYFERAHLYVKEHPEQEGYFSCMTAIYSNLGRCYLFRGMPEKTLEYMEKLDRDCSAYLDNTEALYVLCTKVQFYHETRKISQRDACIEEIHRRISEDMAVMDIFDDFYDFCQLLLELGKDDILWDVITVLDELVKRAKIINLQRKIISLKIKYYRMHKDNAGYLQAAGLYYELTEVMERENQFMITNMLNVRSSLESANERKKKMEETNAKLLMKSETDQLTGLPNRYRLNDYSERAFDHCLEKQTHLAVEILDIDYFKQYNDNYGHQAGDEAINAIAAELKKMVNDRVFCARYGGDEFIIIYEDMTREQVFGLADQLRKRIMGLNLEHLYSKALPVVTISQGICCDIPYHENKNWDFLHVADMMLYKVKKRSRNSICMGNIQEEEILPDYDWK